MTTPMPEASGGLLSNLLGGITGGIGALAGANPLQSSVDQLTNAVNRLTNTMSTLNMGSASGSQFNAGTSTAGGFPGVINPFRPQAASGGGFAGGGPGGYGNVRPPMPFGRIGAGIAGTGLLGSAFANFGQQQMPFQIGLNAMASMSMMGTGLNMNQYGGFASMIGNQVVNPISSSPMDALQLAQQLQFMAGTPRIMGSALGRAGFGAAAAFGMTNPTLSGAMSGNLAQQIYNPMLSMRMRMLGYTMTPRVMGSGMPQSMGNVVTSLLQGWYGANRVNPSQLYRTLSFGGKGFANLQYLGLNPQQMAPLMEGFNRLFNAGYDPQQASNLFSQAASSNPNVARQAQATLRNAGVTSVTSDIQKLRNNQSQLTQRSVNTAAGFNAALTASTDSLQKFNQVLNSILQNTGLSGPLGAVGATLGTLMGTNHGNILNGVGGLGLLALAGRGAGLGRLGLGLAGAGARGVGALGRLGLGGLGPLAEAAGGFGPLGMIAAPAAAGAGLAWWLNKNYSPQLTPYDRQLINSGLRPGMPGWGNVNRLPGTTSGMSGGATSAPQPTTSQSGSGRQAIGGGISGAAFKAVTAAESQLGVPYVWGGEQPGVGFDCSGLVQWAYKQAGINLPRTSQQQWAALRKRAVPTNQAQEGDLVFMAGSDGTPNNPGHVGMMINKNSLIEAPFTGQDVKIIGYDPRQWSHAARPTGRGSLGNAGVSSGLPGNNTGASSSPGLFGNKGMGMGVGNYGSVNEIDLISSTGGFMGGGAGGAFSAGSLGGLQFSNPSALGTGKTTGTAGPMGSGSKQISAEKAFAMQLLKARGWSSQFGALNSIIMAESSWRWNAANPSGAYGIPQALPGSKMAAAGSDWRTNPDTQLRWMIDMYIPQRYGNPANAWAFHQRMGWYGAGGWNLPPGFKMVGERGPELMFSGGGSNILNNAQSMALIKAATSQPQQSPWKTASSQMGYSGQVITPGQPASSMGGRINLTFGANSICVTVGTGPTSGTANTTHDAQSIGNTVAKSIVSHLEHELLLSTIAQGIKG
jgi:cell wall-associated NlpC family hydrolase